jgi:hypothetical protein
MTVTAFWYHSGPAKIVAGSVLWTGADTGGTVKAALMKPAYTPNHATDINWSDISTNEFSSAGYTAGGSALLAASRTVTTSGTSTILDSTTNPAWTGVTGTAAYAVIYRDMLTGAATSPLLGYVDFGGNEVVSSGTFTLTWHASSGCLVINATEDQIP